MIAAVHGSTLPAARGHQQCFQALSLNTLMVLVQKIASVEHHRSYAQAV